MYKRQVHAGDRGDGVGADDVVAGAAEQDGHVVLAAEIVVCLLYTSDAADDLLCVDLGGRRIIKKKIFN